MLKNYFAVFRIGSIFAGTLYALLAAIIFTIVLGIIFHYTSLSEVYLNNLSLAALIISVFLGGKYAAKSAGEKGLLQGLSVGFFFILIVAILTALLRPEQFIVQAVVKKTLYTFLAGGLGGVIGIPSR